DLRGAEAGEVPGARQPDAELARGEGITRVRVGGWRHLVLGVERSPELGRLDCRGLGYSRLLEVGRIDVRAVLPEHVMETKRVLAEVQSAQREPERVTLGDLLGHRDQLGPARRHLRLAVGP